MVPDVDEIDDALEEAWKQRGNQDLRDQARAFALQYDADTVLEKYLLPALRQVEQSIDGYKARRESVVTIPARKEATRVAA